MKEAKRQSGVGSTRDSRKKLTAEEHERARAANRIHCKETRDRRRERERLLTEEVEVLQLCKSIVENGPDLFSLHKPTTDAPFSYLCTNFYTRLQLSPAHMLGMPLSSIVDDRDALPLQSAVFQVLVEAQQNSLLQQQQEDQLPAGAGGGSGGGRRDSSAGVVASGSGTTGCVGGSNGKLIRVRVACGLISCMASMSIMYGTHGLVVVTRLYSL